MNVGGTFHKLGGPDYVARGEPEKSKDKSKPVELKASRTAMMNMPHLHTMMD